MSDQAKPPCPFKPALNLAGRTLSASLPDMLKTLGIAPEDADLVIVLKSRVCGCCVVVADDPAAALNAAEELKVTADRALARAAAEKEPSS